MVRLDYENIVCVYSVDELVGLSYIVFEFVEGVNFCEEVNVNGLLSVERMMCFVMFIVDVFEYVL